MLGAIGFATVPRLVSTLDHRDPGPAAGPPPRTVTGLYVEHFRTARHERMFLASLAFFATFAGVRAITHLIHAGRGPFHDVVTKGGHIHHLVWGILLLLGVGYLWLIQVGTGVGAERSWTSPFTALLFGAASALTLDEFALWFTFRDVYWEREGRLSIDAVVLFGSLLSIAMWGAPFSRTWSASGAARPEPLASAGVRHDHDNRRDLGRTYAGNPASSIHQPARPTSPRVCERSPAPSTLTAVGRSRRRRSR